MDNTIYRLGDIRHNLQLARFRPLDVLVVGATGAGKSSTLNALFQENIARIGTGCEPETVNIEAMLLNDMLRFWDTPGLGDTVLADERYAQELTEMLHKTYRMDGETYGLIDMVVVILDGSGRDMGTTYKLLNEVILPNFQAERILVAINQADMAMKGRHWDEVHGCPDRILYNFLEDKIDSVQARIWEAVRILGPRPVYYSAEKDFNITKLLDLIIDNMPQTRRKLIDQDDL